MDAITKILPKDMDPDVMADIANSAISRFDLVKAHADIDEFLGSAEFLESLNGVARKYKDQ
jgi:hypothetical protein